MNDKENAGPQNSFVAEKAKPDPAAAEAIHDQQVQTQRFMEWWDRGLGKQIAKTNHILSAIEPAWLSDIIAAGQGYHTILTLDRLDALQRQVVGSEPALQPLIRALCAGGGAKSQARTVGMLLFKEARSLFERSEARLPNAADMTPPVAAAAETVILDEAWTPPRLYVNSESYPEGANIAARVAPRKDAQMLKAFPPGVQFLSSGRVGEYLQFRFMDNDVAPGEITGYVPFVINGLELLVASRMPPVVTAHTTTVSVLPPVPPAQPEVPRPVTSHAPQQAQPAQFSQPQASMAPARLESLEVRVGRLEALESRVAQQDCTIQALQSELAALRGHLSAIASTFAPLATSRMNQW